MGSNLILNLSSPPGGSVNDGIQREPFSAQYMSADDIIDGVIDLGCGPLMAKYDIENTYRILYLHFYWAGFTVAQRERAQEDFNVPYEGAPTSPTPHLHTKDSHSTGITLLFSNSAWVLLRPTELSTFKGL